jgi:hypothetical protein
MAYSTLQIGHSVPLNHLTSKASFNFTSMPEDSMLHTDMSQVDQCKFNGLSSFRSLFQSSTAQKAFIECSSIIKSASNSAKP